MRNLKYSFEYFCSPIWIEEDNSNSIYENIEVGNLSINNHLETEIIELDNIYQSKYNDNYPPDSHPFDLAEEIIFTNRVILSAKILHELLKYKFNVRFENDYWNNRLKFLLNELEKLSTNSIR